MQADRDRLARAWPAVRGWLWPGLSAALVIAFIVAVVRPFTALPDPQADDVAQAWNNSLARLGILPVFPPEEDFHVGDLWAVIDENTEEKPLLGKAVRLSHIDLRDQIQAARNGQPVFADTVRIGASEEFRSEPRTELSPANPGDAIALTLTAFPGIDIRHVRRATGSLARDIGRLGAAREEFEWETIRIPSAETYGLNAAAAIGRLDAWCSAPETRIYCTDDFARRVLAFAVSDRVLATRDGRYVVPLRLRLVTRVFLTREIEQRHELRGSGRAEAGADLDKDAIVGAPAEQTEAGTKHAAAAAMLARVDGTEVALRQVFQRPVVFGFRAVTIALTAAAPSSRSQP